MAKREFRLPRPVSAVLARMTPERLWSASDSALSGRPRLFYLVQYRDPRGPTGFGTESVPLPREPSACDATCPAQEPPSAIVSRTETRRR